MPSGHLNLTKLNISLRVAAPKGIHYGQQPIGVRGNAHASRDWKGELLLVAFASQKAPPFEVLFHFIWTCLLAKILRGDTNY